MAGITGMGDTFDLPNFVGDLFSISREDTPLLSAIGGLTGGTPVVGNTRFEWEYYDLRDAAVGRERLEGADAPTATARVRANAFNVLQIVQEAVEISYTKQAAYTARDSAAEVAGTNPVTNEFAWQTKIALQQIARDVNFSIINQTFQDPSDNTTVRKTRGLLAAISTNVITPDETDIDLASGVAATGVITSDAAHGLEVGERVQFDVLTGPTAGFSTDTDYFVRNVLTTTTFTVSATRGGAVNTWTTALTEGNCVSYPQVSAEYLGDAMQAAYLAGGLQLGETRVAVCGPHQKRRLTDALVTDKGYIEATRNIGGVNVQTIETDFGALGILIDRYMPDSTIVLASLEELDIRFLNIPGKGFLFLEELAKTGAQEHAQIYGEWGLEYGNELKHAKLTGLG